MLAYWNVAGAIASILILSGCAAEAGSVAVEHNPACPATGSRLSANGADCSIFSRSYSSEDISRTGATQASEALRLMDPSITVNR
jgi:hypothetical protein